jgi:hypothetical protein
MLWRTNRHKARSLSICKSPPATLPIAAGGTAFASPEELRRGNVDSSQDGHRSAALEDLESLNALQLEHRLENCAMGNHDALLLDRVDTILSTSPYLSRRKVRLETESGRVTLRGEVDSFFQKQMAQEAIRRLDGVREIYNELEVVQF